MPLPLVDGAPGRRRWRLAALLAGNVALALGPWLVRLADSGPVAAGFWRLTLALPLLAAFAMWGGGGLTAVLRARWLLPVIAGAGVWFALDLASWHVGIGMTRLGNAVLFGNSGSIIVMLSGLIAARRAPRPAELGAIAAAVTGAGLLLGRSFGIDRASVTGDLFCLLAGLFYAAYILMLRSARGRLGQWTLLFWSSLAGAPVLLGLALMLGEPVWPDVWWPLIALMLGSQIVGQGLLIYALAHFTPLVIGLSLLTQPAMAALIGWLAFGETLSALDALGMALLASALVLAKLAEDRRGAQRGAAATE